MYSPRAGAPRYQIRYEDPLAPLSFTFPLAAPPSYAVDSYASPRGQRQKDLLLKLAYSPSERYQTEPSPRSPRRKGTKALGKKKKKPIATSSKPKKTRRRSRAKSSRPSSARGSRVLTPQHLFGGLSPGSVRSPRKTKMRRPQSARQTRRSREEFYIASASDMEFIQEDDASSSDIDPLLETAIARTVPTSDAHSHSDFTQYNLLGPRSKITHLRSHLDDLMFFKDPERVLRARIELLALTKLLSAEDNFDLVVAHHELAECYLSMPEPRPVQALQHAMLASELNEDSPIGASTLRRQHRHPRIMLTVARALMRQGRYKQAHAVLREGIKLNLLFHGAANPPASPRPPTGDDSSPHLEPEGTADFYLELGVCVSALGDEEAGDALALKALQLARSYRPEVHPNVSTVHSRLANILSNDKEAIEHLRTANDAYYQVLGAGSALVARTSVALADRLVAADRLEEASHVLEVAVESYRVIYGHRHSLTVSLQKRYLILRLRLGKAEEVLVPLQDVLLQEAQLFGRHSDTSGQTCSLLGSVHLSLGNLVDAEKMYRLAIAIEKKAHGDDSGSTTMRVLLNRLEAVQRQALRTELDRHSDSDQAE